MSKKTEIVKAASTEAIEQLRQSFPAEQGFTRILLPRISFASQDVTEGKGKSMKVIIEAGTFSKEKESDEEDDNGKKIWEKTELGNEIEVMVVYQRRQLKFFDGEKYTSSPIYDNDAEIIPLFKDKQEVDRGTPAELKSRKIYQGKSAKGKDISKLEDNKILYVLYEGDMYQMSLRGTSMYAFKTYAKSLLVPSVLTAINSESKENGSIAWNQMTFRKVRDLNHDEVIYIQAKIDEIRKAVNEEKAFYANSQESSKEADDELDEVVNSAAKQLE